MGRSKSSKSSTSTSTSTSEKPIPFPHDGPIHYYSYYKQNPKTNSTETTTTTIATAAATTIQDDILKNDSSIQAAIALLATTISASDNNNNINNNDSFSANQKLCHNLVTASNIQEQLYALQVYRSNVMNLKHGNYRNHDGKNNPNSKIVTTTTTTTSTASNDNQSSNDNNNLSSNAVSLLDMEMIGLYRLLLEWSLSYQTPVQLQRSIQSVLSCIKLSSSNDNNKDNNDKNNKNDGNNQDTNISEQQDEQKIKIQLEVLQSLWTNDNCHYYYWKKPLSTLDIASNDTNLSALLKSNLLFSDCLTFLFEGIVSKYLLLLQEQQQKQQQQDNATDKEYAKSKDEEANTEQSSSLSSLSFAQDNIVISKILKILLHNNNTGSNNSSSNNSSSNNNTSSVDNSTEESPGVHIPYLDEYQRYVIMLLGSPKIPTDGYNSLGILFGNLLIAQTFQKNSSSSDANAGADAASTDPTAVMDIIQTVELLDQTYPNLSPLARLSMIQGIAARLDLKTLVAETNDIPNSEIGAVSSPSSSSPPTSSSPLESCWRYSLRMSQTATDPMVRWGALKGLSTFAVRWSQTTRNDQTSSSSLPSSSSPSKPFAAIKQKYDGLIQETLQIVLQTWENPPLRKLAKAIPGLFQTLVQLLDNDDDDDYNNNTNNNQQQQKQPSQQIQQLCQSILKQPANRKGKYLALEILLPYIMSSETMAIQPNSLLEGIGDRGPNTCPIADLWTKILQYKWNIIVKTTETKNVNLNDDGTCGTNQDGKFQNWIDHWVPSLAQSLVIPQDLTRRKQIAAFCLPRIVDLMKRIKGLQKYTSNAFVALFEEIQKIREEKTKTGTKVIIIETGENQKDRALWAQLELARNVMINKIFSADIQNCISMQLPPNILRVALTHAAAPIRLAAFQSMEAIVLSYSKTIEFEMELWKYAFPYAAKVADNKDYASSLLQYLSLFLDRLSTWDAKEYKMHQSTQNTNDAILPNIYAFVSKFLIQEVVVSKGAYPGTIADKESFSLLLLECILSFVMQDQSYTDEQHSVGKNCVLFQRKRDSLEVGTMKLILGDLLDCEVFAALFALLHSSWDNTRKTAHLLLSKLVLAAQTNDRQLPTEYSSEASRNFWKARAIHLASSPRQREADTGARILSFLYASISTSDDSRDYFLEELVDLLQTRLNSMKSSLKAILDSNIHGGEALIGYSNKDASNLPLAHGLIQAIWLSIEHHNDLKKRLGLQTSPKYHQLRDRMIELFCQAIRVSLAVVADVRDGETLQGMENELSETNATQKRIFESSKGSATPLNVNTGAIGANGAFSRLEEVDEQETNDRIALQRIIIGSWLLTKEACAAVASIVSGSEFNIAPELVNNVGTLLITTLISLKHAGAAFAARDSLQDIATFCLGAPESFTLHELPKRWANRLVDEISINEKVRDSTLRRSTGYALGIVALMRSELASKRASLMICPDVLGKLLMYSLPPKENISKAFVDLELCGSQSFKSEDFFYIRSISSFENFVSESQYVARCRVHALNILRLVILDAPLAIAILPFIGDAMITAILGYEDSAWAVRNSSTMVFSAIMLRVVDADKNASNLDATSNNAITITELFRRYPPLERFLLAIMQKAVKEKSGREDMNSQSFPVLLLLSRVQSISGSEEKDLSLIKSFSSVIFKCLSDKSHSSRSAASRALANLNARDISDTSSSFSELLVHCKTLVEKGLAVHKNWNLVDGALLGIYELVRSSDTFRTACNDLGVSDVLHALVSPVERRLVCPPSCMATALKTLVMISDGKSASDSFIFKLCRKFIYDYNFENVIGGAELLSTFAVSCIILLQNQLWNPVNKEDLEGSIGNMESILSSDFIDIRISAVKHFKKCIYQNVDNLLAGVSNVSRGTSPTCEEIIAQIGRMLLRCLVKEMGRSQLGQGSIGTHVPTTRRLSRCFLECFQGYSTLSKFIDLSLSDFLDDEEFNTIHSTAIKMVEWEKLLDGTEREVNGETFLSSNAVEMISIVMARQLQGGKHIENSTLEQMNMFVALVEKVNDETASWRSRHSAAVSIETSRMLDPNIDVPYHLKKKLLFQVLRMLQDSDPDVRASAGRTAGHLSQSQESHYALLPELILEMTYGHIFRYVEEENKAAVADELIKTLAQNCSGVIDALTILEGEFHQTSRENVLASDLINATTNRKIFEGVDYNPYRERVFVNQLICQSLICMERLEFGDSVHAMLSLCASVLQVLLENKGLGMMAHDMTRFPTVFSSLHGLLTGATVVLYLGFTDEHGIQNIANKLRETSNFSFHPDVQAALKMLSQAKASEEATKEAIKSSLFLLDK